MSALSYDLAIEQGSRYRLVVPVLDPDGAPLEVDGWSVRGQIRLTYAEPALLYDLTIHLTTAGPAVVLDVPGPASAGWVWREGVYDVELVDPDDNVTRLIQGRVLVSPEATR